MTACALAVAPALGLVRFKTSDKESFVLSKNDLHLKRIKRMQKTILNSARLLVDQARERRQWAMLTLTYRDEVKWEPKQVSELLKHIRQYCSRSGFKAQYVWVLELTQRGRPHYHVLMALPRGRTLPKPDKQGWWKHGFTQIMWARKPVGYIAKYSSKGISLRETCALPVGARIAGNGGLDQKQRLEVRWWNLPLYVREAFAQITDVRRVTGGFSIKETGEFLPSPFHVVFVGGCLMIWKKKEIYV